MPVDELVKARGVRSGRWPSQLGDRHQKVTTTNVGAELARPPRPLHHPVERLLEPDASTGHAWINPINATAHQRAERTNALIDRTMSELAQRIECVWLGQRRLGLPDDPVDRVHGDAQEKVVALGEVPVHRRVADACPLGDRVERHIGAMLDECVTSRLEDALPVSGGIGTQSLPGAGRHGRREHRRPLHHQYGERVPG